MILDNKAWEWAFSGIGILLVTGIISFIRYIRNPIETISIYQEKDEIRIFNNFSKTIEINMCSLSFQDILSRPDLARKDSSPLFTNIQQPVKSNEYITIFKIKEKIVEIATDYVNFDKKSFADEYPEILYPFFVGITFCINFNFIGKSEVKSIKIKRIFMGNEVDGFYITKPNYGKDSYLPKRSKLKENILSAIKDPKFWLKNRKNMRLLQAELDYKGINNALIYGTITKKRALKEMQKVKKVLKDERINEFINYLEKNSG